MKNTGIGVYCWIKLQTEGVQLHQKSTSLAFSKDFIRICNISIFFDFLGTSISGDTFKLLLLTVVKVFKIFISTEDALVNDTV